MMEGAGYSLGLESHRVIFLFCLLHCDPVFIPCLDSEVFSSHRHYRDERVPGCQVAKVPGDWRP